jgi:hypothetical protein
MKKFLVVLVVLVCFQFGLMAQSNDYIDQLLATSEATVAQAMYIALTSGDVLDPTFDEAGALEYAFVHRWPLTDRLEQTVTIGEYAYLLVKAFKIPSGLMYTLFPGPRYALRELMSRRIISGKPDIGRKVSGEELLRIAGNALAWRDSK